MFLGKIRESVFLRQNAVLFVGSLAVSILNYLYYPVLGRLLGLEEYGEVQVLISLFLQLTIFLVVLTQVTVNIVANYQDEAQKNKVIFELEKLAFLCSVGILAVGTLFSWQLQHILHFNSPIPFIVLLCALVITVPVTFRSAYLRGRQEFTAVSVANMIGSAGKIIASALLVFIGFSTTGAIGGLVVAQVLALAYAASRARRLGFSRPAGARYISLPDVRVLLPELKYAAFVLAASLGVAVLSSIDVLVVKYFFDAQTAGGYAGISTVAKIIFFLTASVAQVMLPSLKIQQPKRENRKFLAKSFVLLALLGGATLLVFALIPNFIVTVLMGHRFAPYAYLLPLLSLAMFFMSVINLVVFYYIALRRYQAGVVVVAGVAATVALLVSHHESLQAIVMSLVYGSLAILAFFAVWRGASELYKRRAYG